MDLGRHDAIASDRHETDAGVLEVWEPVPGLFVNRAAGRMESDHADTWIAMADRIISRRSTVAGIFDWLGMDAYDSEVRKRLTDWGLRHRGSIHEVHIAHSSALVRMGVSVANIALGGLILPHASRATLVASYNDLIASLDRGDARVGPDAMGSDGW